MKKLSWSQKEFLEINNKIGKNRPLDFLMKFSAKWLIYIFFLSVVLLGFVEFSGDKNKILLLYVWTIFVVICVSMVFSWCIALIWHENRPIKTFPNIRQLIKPYQTWKSFPSDHTFLSFSLTCVAVYFGFDFFVGLILFILAGIIGFSRIYVGVHYPADVLWGFLLAFIFTPLSILASLFLFTLL